MTDILNFGWNPEASHRQTYWVMEYMVKKKLWENVVKTAI